MAKDLDGLAKNIDKMKKHWNLLKTGMVPHWERFKKEKDAHSYVNLWVEAQRISPYFIGHIDAILYPVLIVVIIVLIII